MVHVVIPEHPAPACDMEIFEPAKILIYLITSFLISNLKQRIGIRHSYHRAAYYLMLFDKPHVLQIFNGNGSKLLIAFAPYPIAFKAEKLCHNNCLALRRHFFAPVRRLMQSAKDRKSTRLNSSHSSISYA